MLAERYDGKMVELPEGVKLVECPICEWCHPQTFNGDCRDDSNRFYTPENPDETNTAERFDEDDERG